MASNLIRFPLQTPKLQNLSPPLPTIQLPLQRTLFPFLPITFFPQKLLHKSKFPSLSLKSSLSSSPSSSYNPPTTKEEAINQAKTCLSKSLEKPLNNPRLSAGKLKKQKQPRLRIEIPLLDDSEESLIQLVFNIFRDLPIRRKGSPINFIIFWPNPTLTDLAKNEFLNSNSSKSHRVQNMDISSVTDNGNFTRILNSADVVVFLVPESSELEIMREISDGFYPKPVLIFNPKWEFEEESGFDDLSGFVGSFEVVYSFLALEVKGLLSMKRAVVFKGVKDGIFSGEKWVVFVEEEGDFKVITKFKKRPSIGEVENVLYNLMAVNSPVTKSAKFLRDLVSNVMGKK